MHFIQISVYQMCRILPKTLDFHKYIHMYIRTEFNSELISIENNNDTNIFVAQNSKVWCVWANIGIFTSWYLTCLKYVDVKLHWGCGEMRYFIFIENVNFEFTWWVITWSVLAVNTSHLPIYVCLRMEVFPTTFSTLCYHPILIFQFNGHIFNTFSYS